MREENLRSILIVAGLNTPVQNLRVDYSVMDKLIRRIHYPFALVLLFVHTCKCQEDYISCPKTAFPCTPENNAFCSNRGICCTLVSGDQTFDFCVCYGRYYGSNCQKRYNREPDESYGGYGPIRPSCPPPASQCTNISNEAAASYCSNNGKLCCIQGSGNSEQKFCTCYSGYSGEHCNRRQSDEFRCSSTETIDKSLVCDGKPDCKDQSDESECNEEYFETDFLLVTDEKQGNIFQVNLTSGETRPIHSVKAYSKISPKAMDYDPMKKIVYYINETLIINGSSTTERDICIHNMTRPIAECSALSYYADAIAVDNRMIGYFWTYIGNSTYIAEINVKYSYIMSFVRSLPGTIKAITLNNDRTAGQLYWSQCESGKKRYSIENAQAGKLSEHQSVVSNLRSCATAIAVDSSGAVIYWGEESGDLRIADLNGNNETLIYQDPLASYAGLAIDSQFLYISDSNKSYIQKLDRNTSVLTNLTGPVFGKLGNIKIHTSSIGVDLDQFDEATNERRPTVTVKTTNEGDLSPFWIAVVVCVFLAVVAAIVTIGVLVAKKMSNVPSTNAEYELTLPTPYVYDGHYDAIIDRPDDKQTQENDLPYNEPEYDYITDDRDSKAVEDKPDS